MLLYNTQNLTLGMLATPSSRLRPDGSQISYMRVYIHMENQQNFRLQNVQLCY
jgi:hypothetical protein